MGDDTKAKDLLHDLPVRERLGERLIARVGARRDDAPGAARRRRLFERLGLPDPYDPKTKSDSGPGLGPVSLKLSERRKPAPHSRVKDPNQKKSQGGPGSFKPSGIPKAPEKPPPRSAAEVAADYAKRQAKKPSASERKVPDIDPAIQRKLQAQRQAQEAIAARRAAEAEAKEDGRGNRGRFRMRRTQATGPKSRPVEPPPEPESVSEEPVEETPKPPPRRAPPGPGGGLDDLFGFADEGRVRVGRQKKKSFKKADED